MLAFCIRLICASDLELRLFFRTTFLSVLALIFIFCFELMRALPTDFALDRRNIGLSRWAGVVSFFFSVIQSFQ